MKPQSFALIRSLSLLICGGILFFLFKRIADTSVEFEQGTIGSQRPIISVLSWFWYAFAAYIVAWFAIGGFSRWRRQPGRGGGALNLTLVFVFAIAFRIIMTPSTPIQEIDLYRYIWDGAVVSNQLDPYQFGPETVFNAVKDKSLIESRPGLEKYVAIVENRPGLHRVLDITHFGQYTSPYPPVSQAVFGMAISTVKPDASAKDYVFAIKTALAIFDLLTGVVVALLLYRVGMNTSLVLGYLWCPLVLKEIANGGHLDSIATFLAVLTVYLTTIALWPKRTEDDPEDAESEVPPLSMLGTAASAVTLAAAFSAKVFPVVLAPIWFVVIFRRSGLQAIFSLVLFTVASYFISLPMLNHLQFAKDLEIVSVEENEFGYSDPSGIEAFSKYWEMNDFLFMLIVENLKPASDVKPPNSEVISKRSAPWFVVTSNEFRQQTINKTRGYFEDPNDPNAVQHKPSHFAFFTTRMITLGIFCVIVAWACFVLLARPNSTTWLEMAFLVTAWFWLLSPTQNPWYWTWSIPLLVFAKGRVWFFLSGTLIAYYLRFWLEYHFTGVDVMNYWKVNYGDNFVQDWFFPYADQYGYQGTKFFDFYVPVLEFGPWFILLFVFALLGYISRRGTQ